jgi:nucleoside-diphosphate kinase
MSNTERTYIMIKPDGVHRGLVGEIIKRFEQKGFKLVALKFMQVSFHILYLLTGKATVDFFYFLNK